MNDFTPDEIKLLLEMLRKISLQGSSESLVVILAQIGTITTKLRGQLQEREQNPTGSPETDVTRK